MNATHRLVVSTVLALGIAVASPLVWWWPRDGPVDGWTVAIALWQVLPFALVLLCHRAGFSEVGTLVTAVAAAALTVAGYVAVERDDSSTAAIGFLFIPIYLSLLVGIAFVVDLGVRHLAARFANRSAKAP